MYRPAVVAKTNFCKAHVLVKAASQEQRLEAEQRLEHASARACISSNNIAVGAYQK